MSYPTQAPAERKVPLHEQPTQQATIGWPGYGHPGQTPAYGTPPAYAVAPPYALAPAQYGPASNYGVVPPQYGTPQYAVVPPAYCAPVLGGYGSRRRPGAVTAAAVLAFVVGGLGILIDLLLLLASCYHQPPPSTGGFGAGRNCLRGGVARAIHECAVRVGRSLSFERPQQNNACVYFSDTSDSRASGAGH